VAHSLEDYGTKVLSLLGSMGEIVWPIYEGFP